MKSYIDELKAKNDFRREGLRGYYKAIPLGILSFWFIYILPYFFLESLIASFLVIIIVVGIFLLWHCGIRGPHKIYNEGKITYGIINGASFAPLYLFGGLGWTINYTFEVSGKRITRHERFSLIRKKRFFLGGKLPKAGDRIIVFYENEIPYNSFLYIPLKFSDWCLKKSRYDEILNIVT